MNIRTVILSLLLAALALSVSADDTTRKMLKRKKESVENQTIARDTIFDVGDKVRLSGYEKPLRSSKESLFITNNTNRKLIEAVFIINYLDMNGRQLNKREVRIDCDIASGETKQAVFPSWDKQKTLYYYLNPKSRVANGTPYKVKTEWRYCVTE